MRLFAVFAALLTVLVAADSRGHGGNTILNEAQGSLTQLPGPDLDGDGVKNDYHWYISVMPIRVALSPELQPDVKAATIAAIDRFEAVIGRDIFGPIETAGLAEAYAVETKHEMPHQATMYVAPGCGATPNQASTQDYRLPDGTIVASLVCGPLHWNDSYIGVMMEHEIGHVLGLDHDYDKTSLMFPTVYGDGSQHLMSDDLAVLRKIYGPRATDAEPVLE